MSRTVIAYIATPLSVEELQGIAATWPDALFRPVNAGDGMDGAWLVLERPAHAHPGTDPGAAA